jgi:hypothetical protein
MKADLQEQSALDEAAYKRDASPTLNIKNCSENQLAKYFCGCMFELCDGQKWEKQLRTKKPSTPRLQPITCTHPPLTHNLADYCGICHKYTPKE